MVSVIQDSIDFVEQWSCDNDTRIKTSKTKEMVTCFRKERTFVDSLPYIDITGKWHRFKGKRETVHGLSVETYQQKLSD